MEKKNELMKKRAALVALSAALVTGTPTNARGGILDIFSGNMTGEEIEATLDEASKPLVNIDNAINDFAAGLVSYKHDTLQIVTTVPTANPDEKRDYHFLNTKFPTLSKISFLDANGNKVDKNSSNALYRVTLTLHKDIEDNEYMYREKTITNLKTYEVKRNTVKLNKDEQYLDYEDSEVEYGLFTDIADIIPEQFVKDTYTMSDILWISENVLNNPDYKLGVNSGLTRTK